MLGGASCGGELLPVDVVGLTNGVTAIVAGWDHTCALTNGGAVKCWGYNGYGQLGDGTTTDRLTPVNVVGLTSGVVSITSEGDHTCAVLRGGGVKCWGDNQSGQLGDGTAGYSSKPGNVVGLSNGVTAIEASGDTSCALTTGGGVKCWGYNGYGQLGDGTNTDRLTPVGVVGLTSGITAIAAGSQHTCALTTGGGVKCWGYNGYGQLGDGTNTDRLTPVDVVGLPSGITAIAAGSQHTCALTDNGGILCWGLNSVGQLGNGTIINSSIPVNISGLLSGMTAVTAGASQSCSLTSSGGVKIWGGVPFICGGYLVPADWEGLTSNVIGIALGGIHNCVLILGGSIKCWGWNFDGELGDGTTSGRYTPVDTVGLDSIITDIATGDSHTCSLSSIGEVKCWGRNVSGQLGNGIPWYRTTPVDVVGFENENGEVFLPVILK